MISATNRDLAAEIATGEFRHDLFYRLNVVTKRVRALRDRKEDIHLVAQHFIQKHGKHHTLKPELMGALCAFYRN